MTRIGALLAVFTLGFGSVGLAQSPRERAWAEALGEALGAPARAEPVRATLEVETPDGTVREHAVRGVRADLGDVVVSRLLLDSADAARDLFAHHDDAGPIVGELRGAQVVFVKGERVRDPVFARRALDAAWVGLPAPAARSEAASAALGPGGAAVRADSAVEAVVRPIRDACARARSAEGEAAVDGQAGREDVALTLRSGFSVRLHVGQDGSRALWADGPERLAALERYAEVLFAPDAAKAAPRAGFEEALDAVLGWFVEDARGPGGLDPGAALDAASATPKRAVERQVGPVDRPLGE